MHLLVMYSIFHSTTLVCVRHKSNTKWRQISVYSMNRKILFPTSSAVGWWPGGLTEGTRANFQLRLK